MTLFDVDKYLDDIEQRIDLAIESSLIESWYDFAQGDFKDKIYTPRREKKSRPSIKWPKVSVNTALEDYDAMLISQLGSCSRMLERGSGELLCVRANYGTSIIPSLFGAKVYLMDDASNTLPTSYPLAGGLETIKRLLDRGIPSLDKGFGGKALEMGKRFKDKFLHYPKISKHVHVYHPDVQGPMDICELLVGSDLFVMIYDYPDIIKELLELITIVYSAFLDEWYRIFPPKMDFAVHWGAMHRGHIMLRDDSAMNFSPEMYDEFIRPFDQSLLDRFGGGAVHFCGRGDHWIDRLVSMTGANAVAMSQPECNDMEKIFTHTVDKGIQLILFPYKDALTALGSGRNLHHSVQTFESC